MDLSLRAALVTQTAVILQLLLSVPTGPLVTPRPPRGRQAQVFIGAVFGDLRGCQRGRPSVLPPEAPQPLYCPRVFIWVLPMLPISTGVGHS